LSLAEFVYTYFTSTLTGAAFLALLIAGVSLLAAFGVARENPRGRSRILFGTIVLLIFTWSFVSLSLVVCSAFFRIYEAIGDVAVTYVLGLALLTSMIVAVPISFLVASRAPRLLLARLERELLEPDAQTNTILQHASLELGIKGLKLRQLPSESPLACTFGGREGTIVISEALGRLLDRDEMEAVLAHELAHAKSRDSNLNVLLSVYRKILFFDPVLRSLESRFHREREFAADEFSAFFTRKPLSLASALLKISRHGGSDTGDLAAVVSVMGVGWYQTGRELRERVMRLVHIADRLEAMGRRVA
jgi:Zn-dependent protease with chaperone function